MAAPAFLAAGTPNDGSPGSQVALPAGLATNDIVLVQALAGNNAVSLTDPEDVGYTLIDEVYDTGISSAFWWKRAGASETAPIVSRGAGGAAFLARCYAYRGCITTGTPFEDATLTGDSSTTPATATIDTLGADRLAVCLYGIDDDTAWAVSPPPGSWALDAEYDTAASTDGRIGAISIEHAAQGQLAGLNIGTLSGAELWIALTLALIPPAGASSDLPRQPTVAGRAVARASRW